MTAGEVLRLVVALHEERTTRYCQLLPVLYAENYSCNELDPCAVLVSLSFLENDLTAADCSLSLAEEGSVGEVGVAGL